jgi:hypothetical protein
VKPLKVAIPAVAPAVDPEVMVATPDETVAVTLAVEVVAFPEASATQTIGWVVQAIRDWQVAAAVFTIN